MVSSRLSYAIDAGAVDLASAGSIAVFRPPAGQDLSALDKDGVDIIQGYYPDHQAFLSRGFNALVASKDSYDAAIVFLPRAKALAHQMIARAFDVTNGGPVVIDGQKTDGVDSILKACRRAGAGIGEVVAKSHGKIFSVAGGDFAHWRDPGHRQIGDGFVTSAGVFSADGIDRGSRTLVAALPDTLSGRVGDLGAGWGYLSRHVLLAEKVTECHLIEAEFAALECARENVLDLRAGFHWADALSFAGVSGLDHVVSNPPFHTGRSADPDLGRSFISAAARLLAGHGTLWLVANRHLPYEQDLSRAFHQVSEVAGDNSYKVFRASKPKRTRK